MIEKVSLATSLGYSDGGSRPIYLAEDTRGEKLACLDQLLPSVRSFLASISPEPDTRYLLVNAMGAHEYWGPNSNHDAWPEAALVHLPKEWRGEPVHDKSLVHRVNWPYGLPTFYFAHAFCFPGSMEVVLADRRRVPIQTVSVGDKVATEEGPREVSHVWKRHFSGKATRLLVRGLRDPLVSTDNHPFLVYRRDDVVCPHKYFRHNLSGGCKKCKKGIQTGPRWVEAKDIEKGDFLLIPRHPHGEEDVSASFAELVGWVASDGYLHPDGTLMFTFARPEKIERVVRCLTSLGYPPKTLPLKTQKASRVYVSSRELCRELSKYIQGTLREKRLTKEVLLWGTEPLLRLISSFVDGDGHVGKKTGQVRIRTASRPMMDSLLDVLRSLGVPATSTWDNKAGVLVSRYNGKSYPFQGSGCVEISASWASRAAPYSDKIRRSSTPRKSSCQWSDHRGFFLASVTDVSSTVIEEEVYNLEVEGTHTYVAGEVLVHNCHHRNKDPKKKIGDVVLSVWNDGMKRVELVLRVEKILCQAHGAADFWSKMENGEFPAVSMGSKVPWDRCVGKGTLVCTARGYIPIEDVRVGDAVLSHKGRYRRVRRTFSREEATWKVKVSGTPEVSLTGEHPLWVLREDSPEWVEVAHLQPGDLVAVSVREEPAPCETPNEDLAYLYGVFLGDGWAIRNQSTSCPEGVSFSLGYRKKAVLDRVIAVLTHMGYTPRVYDYPDKSSWTVHCYGKELGEGFERLLGRGSKGKRIPQEAVFWDEPSRRALVQGLLETDGCSSGGALRVSSINLGLMLGLRQVLWSLGHGSSITKQPVRTSGFSSSHRVYSLRIHRTWVGRPPAKNAKARVLGGVRFCPLESCQRSDVVVPVFNLSVEEDESFVAGGLITHNCSVSTDLDEFYRALASYNPAEHAHPGIAVLRWHERMIRDRGHGIPGIARTRAEYGPLMRYHAGQIDQKTGKRIFVFNDFPRFFDISLVRVGADKTAYTMISLAPGETLSKVAAAETGLTLGEAQKKIKGRVARSLDEVLKAPMGGGTLAEAMDADHRHPLEVPPEYLKSASPLDRFMWSLDQRSAPLRAIELLPPEPFFKEAEIVSEAAAHVKKALQRKKGEIQKDVDGVVTHVTKGEPDLDKGTIEEMAKHKPEDALGTAASLGIVLRPREFTRMCLCRMMGPSYSDMADFLDLPRMPAAPPMGLSILPSLLSALLPYFGMRSGFHEPLSSRVSVVIVPPQKKLGWERDLLETSLPEGFLDKLGSLYQSYRSGLMMFVPEAPYLLEGAATEEKVAFLHQAQPADLFTPLSARYFQVAFSDELSR